MRTIASIAPPLAGAQRGNMNTPAPSLWNQDAAPALLASRHRATGEILFPPVLGTSPLADRYETVPLDGDGLLYSYTVIHPAAKTGLAPYALGLVDLPGPVRIFGRLVGTQQPAIGDRFRVRPDAAHGYVFASATTGACA
jgi:uncharacterized OB-fold protein